MLYGALSSRNAVGVQRRSVHTMSMTLMRQLRKPYAHGSRFKSVKTFCRTMATNDSCGLAQEPHKDSEKNRHNWEVIDSDPFDSLKDRFLKFKKQNYLKNLNHYQNLAEDQSPKFMVIACVDSRVCPSKILGFEPGEAFTVRNVANLVPPYQEHGASETSAALEFAVNTLEVENILIVGHSRCAGIRALMSMEPEDDSKSFIRDWVCVAKGARLSTEAAVGNLCFDAQCTHCEKESINSSLLNLLTYPWIERRLAEGVLSLHGGYYDFTNCSFNKWSMVYRKSLKGGFFSVEKYSTWS
ncbi:hypothetical protein HPP92_003819 [Vanilla planifolia]|nr:hypothetical protein HPP92_003819 [Vanilla planifolia]